LWSTRVGEDHDHVNALCDVGTQVGNGLGSIAARRSIEDASNLGIGQCLLDELHGGDASPDVLAEAVGIGHGNLAARACVAGIVVPALERLGAQFPGHRLGSAIHSLDEHWIGFGRAEARLHQIRAGLRHAGAWQ
jgi:hypothetical protein